MSSLFSYSLTEEGSGYSFVTDSDVPYAITFIDCSTYLQESNLYGIIPLSEPGFDVQHGHQLPNRDDPRIKLTLAEAVNQYFNTNPLGALLITYDSSDGRQNARGRLFSRWISQITPIHPINKAYFSVDIPGVPKSDHTLMTRKDNPYSQQVTQVLLDYVLLLSTYK